MAAVAHRCPSCSAPLPAAEPGSAVTCGHCGVQSRLPGRDDASDTATIIGGQPEAGAGKGGGCGALLLVFGVPFGIVGLVVCASIALPGLIGGGAAGLVVVGDAREQAEEAQREAMERVLEAQREAEERRLEEAEARGISRSQLVEIPRGWTNFAERPPGVDLADMNPST